MTSTTPARRSARNQDLPAYEARLLNALPESVLPFRIKDLYILGWPVRAIRAALVPEQSAGKIRAWTHQPTPPRMRAYLSKLPAPQAPFIAEAEKVARRKPKKYPPSPGLSPDDFDTLLDLTYYAKRYRSSMGPDHPSAKASIALNNRLRELRATGVTISELADACELTYRSISRRISADTQP